MKPTDTDEALLHDVLADDAFAAEVLAASLAGARGRRRRRVIGRLGALASVMAIAVLVFFQSAPDQESSVVQPVPAKSYALLRTQPLVAGAVVETRGGMYAMVETASARPLLRLIATMPGRYHEISDHELLALVNPAPAALMRISPGMQRLVFVEPEDEKRFLN